MRLSKNALDPAELVEVLSRLLLAFPPGLVLVGAGELAD